MHQLASLCFDFRQLGVRTGQPMVVHSALRALAPVDGGADTVIRALRECVGDSGTLLFPNLNIPHEFTAAHPPRFDLQKGLVRERLGGLPQVFKALYAREFSRHPTHAMMGFIDAGVEYRVRSRLHRWGNASDFARINPWLENAGGLRRGRVGNADCLLIDAGIFQAQVIARLVDNPRFLLV